ncbi:MAG: YihY/virulence factor BrkB family protein [Gammaproteobacteria bacterium]|nr:YihY/virulence factor BrkB family protein [Gammaproteobacteria bacterium]
MKTKLNFRFLKRFYLENVWQTSQDTMSVARSNLVTGLRITHLIIRDLLDGMITLRAMGLVYTTILALVPLLAVSFSVLKGFGVHNQVEPMLLSLFQPLGEKGAEVTAKIIEFVDNTKAGVLGTLGLALLMYTVVSLLQKIERAFNYTWRVTHHRPIGQRFSDYLTVVLIGPVLLFSALGVTASVSNLALIQEAMEMETIGFMVKFFGRLVPYLLVICAFTFVYVFVPNTRVKIKSALVGAIVAGILWETASWAFAAFVVTSAKYTAIYSAFATLIIFFIWLYVNWLILLIGCSIVFYHQQPSHRHLGSRVVRLSNRLRESLALNIMLLIGRHYHLHRPAWSIDTLAEHMGVSAEVCSLLVERLVKARLLTETSESPATYLPAYDIETLTLDEIISSVRSSGESSNLSSASVKPEPEIADVLLAMEDAIKKSLQGRTLKDLSVTHGDDDSAPSN